MSEHTVSETVSSIKCSNCAAPLNILGGGRVSTVTCEYCHSVLDLNDNYAVLSKFEKVKRPLGPFKIGMRGNIKGVEWTIIGWVTYKTIEFSDEEWNEFFLYSPTHGYAWLVYEDGKISLSMKVRDFDLFSWKIKKPKTLFYKKGHYILDDESYMFYIDYVEGELNWIAKFGDKFTCWDYKGVGHRSLSIEKNINELEVFHTTKLNKKDIYTAFDLEYTSKSKTRKDETFSDDDESPSIFNNYKIFFIMPLLLLILAFSSLFYSKTVYDTSYRSTQEQNFKIDSSAFLTSIKISVSGVGTANNRLSLYKGDEKIFYIDKQKVFFVKKDIGKSWVSNAIAVTIYLKLDKGIYHFIGEKNANQSITSVKIEQQVIRVNYLIYALILFVLLILLSYYKDSE